MTVLRSSLKRAFLALGLPALGALALGACSVPEAETGVAPPPPPVEEAELPPVEEPEAVVEKPVNKIALLLPLSGRNERVGRSLANAASMALADLGETGVTLTAYDTAPGASEAARRAMQDGAGLILGPLLAENATAVRSAVGGNSVPILSFSNDLSVAGNGVWLLGFQPEQSVRRVVQFARAQGVSNFAALVPEGVYGRRASQAFLQAVNSAGGRVTAIETYKRQKSALSASVRRLTDYDARAARAASGGVVRRDGTVRNVEDNMPPVSFDALMIADGGAIASEFLQPLERFDAGPGKVRYLGTELWNADPRVSQVEGLRGSWFASVPDGRFTDFARRFENRFGGRPSRLASLAYDAVLLAAGNAKKWTPGEPFPRSILAERGGFVGLDGIFRFGTNGVAERGMEVQQVAPGGAKVVAPAPTSFPSNKVSMLAPIMGVPANDNGA